MLGWGCCVEVGVPHWGRGTVLGWRYHAGVWCCAGVGVPCWGGGAVLGWGVMLRWGCHARVGVLSSPFPDYRNVIEGALHTLDSLCLPSPRHCLSHTSPPDKCVINNKREATHGGSLLCTSSLLEVEAGRSP